MNSIRNEITTQSQLLAQLLEGHFLHFYRTIVDAKLVPQAIFEELQPGVRRCLSGIPTSFLNPVFGLPEGGQWDHFIAEQLDYFSEAGSPFSWIFDERADPAFEALLRSHGFEYEGIYKGVVGPLLPSKGATVPGYLFEKVEDDVAMEEFIDCVGAIHRLNGAARERYKKFIWRAAQGENASMIHWVARKEGRILSALSSFQESEWVSIWNVTTLPEGRGKGLSTALWRLALLEAYTRGCRTAASYLMPDGMALGICEKLGAQVKWGFHLWTFHQ